ncbi:MAG: ATP-dependent zinc metalloprotease FtsH [Thermodesulfobacteriota bacterium]
MPSPSAPQPPQNAKFPTSSRHIWISLLWIFLLAYLLTRGCTGLPQVPYTQFKSNLKNGNLESVQVKGDQVTGQFSEPVPVGDGEDLPETRRFLTYLPSFGDPDLMDLLEEEDVAIHTRSDDRGWLGKLIVTLLPWLLIIGFFVYSSQMIQKRMEGGGGGLFNFGKSKAKRYDKTESEPATFEDVAGLDAAKQELREIVAFLKEPDRFQKLGGKLPQGLLLAGPPGSGKTLMARAVAGEADVPFYSISGSEFIEMFVGVGASRVRDMFKDAKSHAPAIIFIDEIDSIGRTRGAGLGGGHDEREQTLNQILAEMDGFEPHESVVVMAATNRPDVLDPALVRPGRFDRRINVELPDRKAREKILEIHTREVPLADDIDLERLAAGTVGFSGADLENLVNEAALVAGRNQRDEVRNKDFDEALDKLRMGLAREEYMSDEERRKIAYHEAGHTLMACMLPGTDPVKKVTIIPHGKAMGATEQLPEEDRHVMGRQYLLNRIAVMMGGRMSERIVFGEFSSGAANDLKESTRLARHMVCQWGMSEKIGPAVFEPNGGKPFLGKELSGPRDHSEDTARIIDEEIRAILNEMEALAEGTLTDNRARLEAIAEALLKEETLQRETIEELIEQHA